jgi:hypothetical protein
MINKIIGLLAVSLFIISCGGSEETKSEKDVKTEPEKGNETIVEPAQKIAYDTLLTASANLIAGLSPDHKGYESIISSDYYKIFAAFTSDAWKVSDSTMLKPIANWCRENNIIEDRDSLQCFYPLSGPDFLFGNAFWPTADKYIMLGLEPKGSLADFTTMKEPELKKYFTNMQGSMRYLNTRGYFVTAHMSSDFTKYHLNGMVHMMLYMMARTNHKIIDVYYVNINDDGTTERVEDIKSLRDGAATAVAIDFTDAEQTKKRTAYYFQIDASDENLAVHPGFEKFVMADKNRVAYMKSASCVLMNSNFKTMRQLVLSCDQIVQDDTGVPYHYFDANTFDITLFGTYTSTIRDLSYCLQRDLVKAVKESPYNKTLPFQISYNGNYGEGMLLYARKKEMPK